MKKILTGVFALMILAGCKKGTTITYRVINHSGEQITFTSYYDYSSRGSSSAIVNNGDTRDILIMGKADGSFESDYQAGEYIDSIKGISNTNKMVTKDLTKASNWSKVTTKKQRLHTFTAEIKAADLK
ncbi:MAG: hypothetical protein H6550_13555 [Chitinophagales bacterium]|nr:hypothetical protein [Chitinophagales bacterium]